MLQNVRIWFQKKGTAKYISHLDLTHCMGRALKLSGLPVWYTQGFNPRIYMTFAMPLSLGVSGERECMDIRLTGEAPLEGIPGRLNARLPQGLRVLGASEPRHKLEEIAWADYEVQLDAADGKLLQSLTELLSQGRVVVTKHGKKGDKAVDIKPHFAHISIEARPGQLALSMRLPCSVSGSVNPGLLLEALKLYKGIELCGKTVRKGLLLEDFSPIW